MKKEKRIQGEEVKPVPVTKETKANAIDLAVATKMGLDLTVGIPEFSSDPHTVNDMVAFAREKGIRLPLFTSDPYKIASTIAAWEEK